MHHQDDTGAGPRAQRHRIRFGAVSLFVQPWRHPSGRGYWRFSYTALDGRRRTVTRATLREARVAAQAVARELHGASVEVSSLPVATLQRLARLLAADPALERCEGLLAADGGLAARLTVAEACERFLAAKQANRGASAANVSTLRKVAGTLVGSLGDREVAAVGPGDLDALLVRDPRHSARTRDNERSALVTMWRWFRDRGLVADRTTAAERTERPIVVRAVPATWAPEELETLLRAVRPDFLPWLALAAFAGIRGEELFTGHRGGRKRAFDWADFHWDRGLLEVLPETAKTGRRRVVPIGEALRSWLWPLRKRSGPVCTGAPPHHTPKGGVSETTRLGALVGGWRRNAMRHSFISYRAALVGIATAAGEAGNSEAEARRSYNDAKGRDEAERWFSRTRSEVSPENI